MDLHEPAPREQKIGAVDGFAAVHRPDIQHQREIRDRTRGTSSVCGCGRVSILAADQFQIDRLTSLPVAPGRSLTRSGLFHHRIARGLDSHASGRAVRSPDLGRPAEILPRCIARGAHSLKLTDQPRRQAIADLSSFTHVTSFQSRIPVQGPCTPRRTKNWVSKTRRRRP